MIKNENFVKTIAFCGWYCHQNLSVLKNKIFQFYSWTKLFKEISKKLATDKKKIDKKPISGHFSTIFHQILRKSKKLKVYNIDVFFLKDGWINPYNDFTWDKHHFEGYFVIFSFGFDGKWLKNGLKSAFYQFFSYQSLVFWKFLYAALFICEIGRFYSSGPTDFDGNIIHKMQ